VIIAIGAREKESKTVSIRRIGSDKTESMTFNEALKVLSNENSNPHQSGN
jgi:threonyl-tRNA synthetase